MRFFSLREDAAGALYVALWFSKLIKESDLLTFHKDNTEFPGHPATNFKHHISFGTGSLGHGLSLASGTALAFKLKKIKKIFPDLFVLPRMENGKKDQHGKH